jgi:hypothetical protein
MRAAVRSRGALVAALACVGLAAGEDSTTFVQGATSHVASPVAVAGRQDIRLLIEAEPARVRPGDPYVLRYSLLNRTRLPLTIGAVSVHNALEGAGVTGGSVEPRVRTAAPKSRTLLVETKGTWSYDATAVWATTLTVVLDDGSVYRSTLRTRRDGATAPE